MSKPATSRGWVCAFCIVPVMAIIAIALLGFSPATHGRTAGRASAASPSAGATPAARAQIQANYAALPLAFEPNQGQTDTQVKYVSRANGYTLFLTANEAVFSLHSQSEAQRSKGQKDVAAAVRMQLLGGNSLAKVSASDRLPGYSNYFIGNDPSKWQSGVARYGRVAYQNVYPGVNLAFHGAQHQLEFDFLVAAGSDPGAIGLHFIGNTGMKTDDSGNLVLSSAAGDVLLHKPVAYQEQNGSRQPVEARFALKANNQVAFDLGNYDRRRELVIDPSVSYATFLGGTLDDFGSAIAFDGTGNAYVTGQTASTDFPVVAPGVLTNTNPSGVDVFVTKINTSGAALVYSTYVGGTLTDSGYGIAVDSSNNAFVAGTTASNDFPVSAGAYQTTLKPGAGQNAFMFELNPNGDTLTYSTYLGGTVSDSALGLALDSSVPVNVYVAGKTSSINFPTKNPPAGSITAGGFLAKLTLAGTGLNDLLFSTFIGGGSSDFATAVAIPPNSSGSSAIAYVTGQTAGSLPGSPLNSYGGGVSDAFVVAINASTPAYVYSRYLGGSLIDIGDGIAADSTGAYVTGETASSADFPLKSPLQSTFGGGTYDAFVTKLDLSGAPIYSTFLGGGGNDVGASIAVDGSGNAYITGQTASVDFPTINATQSAFGLGNSDAFVTEINATGTTPLVFSTYLGGSGDEDTGFKFGAIAVDSAGANIYVTGDTKSTDFPTVAPFQAANKGGHDAFVAKYTQAGSLNFTLTATALSPSSVSPGGSSTSTVTAASTNGFTGSVTLSCSVSPAVTLGPTCSGSTTPGTPGTLTVSTSAATALLRGVPNGHSSGMFYAILLPIAGISLVGIRFNPIRSRRKKLFGFLMIGMVMATLLFMPACGGSSSKSSGSPGTPAGTYTITVTGTATGATQTGTSPSLTLTVN